MKNRTEETTNEQEWDEIALEDKWKTFFECILEKIFERKDISRWWTVVNWKDDEMDRSDLECYRKRATWMFG